MLAIAFSVAEAKSPPLMTNKLVAEFPEMGVAGPLTGISNDALIVAGGANFPDGAPWGNPAGKKVSHQTIRVLTRDAKSGICLWAEQTWELPKPLGYSACVSEKSGVICVGGENADGAVDDVLILTWIPQPKNLIIGELPKLPEPRTNAAAVIAQINKVPTLFVIGGETKDEETGKLKATTSVLSLNLQQRDAWKIEPSLSQPTSHAVAVVQSDGAKNCIYLLGGRAKLAPDQVTTFYNTVFCLVPGAKEWTSKTPRCDENGAPRPFAAGSGAPMGIGSILIFGGDAGNIFNSIEERAMKIAALEDGSEERTQIEAELLDIRENHQGFSKIISSYNTITNRWYDVGDLPFTAPVTTPAVLWNRDIVFPTGEIRPAVRTTQIQSIRFHSNPHFGWINYCVLGLYALGMLSLGFIFQDAKEDQTTSNYFTGGGQLPWWVVGVSIFATTLSAITFLSIPAKAFTNDWSMFFLNFGILLVAPVIVWCYLPFFRQLKTESAYEYLEGRFNRLVRWVASLLFCTFMIARIAIVLYLPSLAINVITGMDIYVSIVATAVITIIYCTMGGMKAVVWGDFIQGVILVGGAAFSVIFLVWGTDGGFDGFLTLGNAANKFHALNLTFDYTQAVFWVVIVAGIANSLITYSSDQTIIQRYMSTADQKKAAQSIWLNACIAIPVTVLFFLIGSGLYTYYISHPASFPLTLENNDAIYPFFIVNSLPAGLAGLLVAAIFAAAMSTLSSNINSTSAAITCDFVKVFFPNLSQRSLIRCGQWVGIIAGLSGMIMAMMMATWDIKSLWDQFNFYLGLLTGSLGGLFLMGIFIRRIDSVGALGGVIGSFAALQWLSMNSKCSFLLYGFLGMTICCVIGLLISLVSPNKKRFEMKTE